MALHRCRDHTLSSPSTGVHRHRALGWKPVRRGLVESPEFWRWSSYRANFLGETGPVNINEWEVLKMKMRSPAA
ncbi:MAG: hypothetical protein WCA13_00070 [Terriglobales bacterium]